MTHQLKVLASNDGLEKDEGLSTGLVRRGGQEILQLHPEQLDTMLLQSPLPGKDQKYFELLLSNPDSPVDLVWSD